MFNIGPGELAVILVLSLIVLGPKRLPEMARTIGKFLREFRRQTEGVRTMVEREFYKLDQDILAEQKPAKPIIDDGHDERGRLILPTAAPAAEPAPAVVAATGTEGPAPAAAAEPAPATESAVERLLRDTERKKT